VAENPRCRSPPLHFDLCLTKKNQNGGIKMQTINLRDYYPSIYTSDYFIEVPDEVEDIFITSKRNEAAYHSRKYYNKAQYSLDRDDGIEHHILNSEPSVEDIYERDLTAKQILAAIDALPDKQARRIYAHYF
jgi:RNA polymerase sigma-70 factor (ECF subfamily)